MLFDIMFSFSLKAFSLICIPTFKAELSFGIEIWKQLLAETFSLKAILLATPKPQK
jgi:hypothetical protein